MGLPAIIENLSTNISDHLPDIILGTSLAASTAAAIYGITVTPKVVDDIVEWVMLNTTEEERIGLTKPSEFYRLVPFKIKAKIMAKKYWPVLLGLAVSTGGTMSAEYMYNEKLWSATAIATALSTRIDELTSSTKEIVGPTKYDEIEARAAQKAVDRNNASAVDDVYYSNRKTEGFPIIDDISGTIYVVDRESLDQIQTRLNNKLRSWDRVSYNEFRSEFYAPMSAIGNDIGYDIKDGYIHFVEDMRGGMKDGKPIGVLRLADQMSVFLPNGDRMKFRV